MARKKRKSVSFDAMVKFFILNYDIPTKSDIEKLNVRLDRLEALVKKRVADVEAQGAVKLTSDAGKKRGRKSATASDTVFKIFKRSKRGLKFANIQAKTGYEEKKLRNIIFRLHSLDRIQRVSRGVYTAAK